jgi:hypothetical protein
MTVIRTDFAVEIVVLALLVTGSLRSEPTIGATLAVPANPAPHPAPEQPLPFSHQQHAGTLHLECRTCHINPEPGTQMTFPATSVCMSCHIAIAGDKPSIKRLTKYAESDQPIPWLRVYTLLPGVTWAHRPHLQSHVQCESCHGSVRELPEMREMTAVTSMASCISCHQIRHVSVQCVTCHAWPAR